MRNTTLSRLLCLCLALLVCLTLAPLPVARAESAIAGDAVTLNPDLSYVNRETGFAAYVMDAAEIWDATEREAILQALIPATEYADFVALSTPSWSGEDVYAAVEDGNFSVSEESAMVLLLDSAGNGTYLIYQGMPEDRFSEEEIDNLFLNAAKSFRNDEDSFVEAFVRDVVLAMEGDTSVLVLREGLDRFLDGDGNYHYAFYNFEQLKEVIQREDVAACGAYYWGEAPLVIPENFTIPKGVRLTFYELPVTVAAGATLTIGEDAVLYCCQLDIEGTLENYGYLLVEESRYSDGTRVDSMLRVRGRLLNAGYLSAGPVEGKERIENEEGARSYFTIIRYASEGASLESVAAEAEADPDVDYQFWVDVPLHVSASMDCEDFHISVSNSELVIDEGVTLSLNWAALSLYDNSTVRVEGTLINNWFIQVSEGSKILLAREDAYEGDDEIYCDGEFPLEGIAEERFTRTEDNGRVTYRLAAAKEPAPAASLAGTVTNSDPAPAASLAGTLTYSNPATGYQAVILDDLELMSQAEREKLLEDMKPVTQYGNVAFWSTDVYASRELEQARLKRRELFGLTSGTIFVINMNIRKISLQNYGYIESLLPSSKANTITNNVRNYATRGDYYSAASKAYAQVVDLMEGNRIAEPMKHLSNACIALMLGLMLMLLLVFRHASSFTRPAVTVVLGSVAGGALSVYALNTVHTSTERKYSPPSSDSGSSCSSCGGGGGSSCSSCGSGGSSSF